MPIKSLLKSLCVIVAFLFVVSMPQEAFASHILFQDDFNDGNAAGWEEHVGPGGSWSVINGEYVGQVNQNPSNTPTYALAGDTNWKNYIFEFSVEGTSGVDKVARFRYKSADELYRVQLRSSPFDDLVIEKASPTDPWIKFVSFPNSQNTWYRIKIIANDNNIKVYIDDSLKFDFIDNANPILNGKIMLEVWPGAAAPTTINHFDNVVVTGIDNILGVPYYSQNALPWGPAEYDSTASLGFADYTMDRWGCAVTSSAMLLNYHGMMELADGTPLDPGSLNDWLKNNNGYLTGTGTGGSYSYLLWPTISKLTKQLFDAGKSTTKLEHKRVYPSAATTQLLNDDLLVRKIPDILQVQNVSTSGHFVVATGSTNSSYALNDPEWNVPDLSSFGNTYSQVDRFVPSNTNLGYIAVVINAAVDLLVTDPIGQRTGKDPVTGQLFNDIPGATYALENPISNPNDQNAQEQLGSGVHVFLLPQPLSGHYDATASAQTNEAYTVNVATFETDGTSDATSSAGTVGPGTQDNLTIDYSQTATSPVAKIITFQSTLDDINEAYNLHLITNNGFPGRLKRKIQAASQDVQNNRLDLALQELSDFEDLLNKERGRKILEDAYQILLADETYLKTHL